MFEVVFYTSPAGRQPARDALDDLDGERRAQVLADIVAFSERGMRSAVSWKAIKGQPNRPMMELRTRDIRTLFIAVGQKMTVLHVCRKQDQVRGIEVARKRMKDL
jgi:phage-related protein